MRKIRVLAIAPYEALKTQILALAEGFDEIEITPFVGDLEEGLEIAEANFHGNFDIVLSRGATAELLRAKLSIPVVGIDISIYDILFALRLSDADTDETAIVSFADLRDNVRTLSTLTEYRLDCFIIPEAKDARSVLIECKRKGYKTVLCDMIADRIAKELGLNSFLITSGESSIINAFKEILRLAKAMDDLRSENALLRTLFLSQIGKTVVLDDEKRLFLSSAEEIDSSVLEMLRAEARRVFPIRSSPSLRGAYMPLNTLCVSLSERGISTKECCRMQALDVEQSYGRAGYRFHGRTYKEEHASLCCSPSSVQSLPAAL